MERKKIISFVTEKFRQISEDFPELRLAYLFGSQIDGQNGTDSGSFTFTPTGSGITLYYNCSIHSGMGNSISLVDYILEDEVPHTLIGSVDVVGN